MEPKELIKNLEYVRASNYSDVEKAELILSLLFLTIQTTYQYIVVAKKVSEPYLNNHAETTWSHSPYARFLSRFAGAYIGGELLPYVKTEEVNNKPQGGVFLEYFESLAIDGRYTEILSIYLDRLSKIIDAILTIADCTNKSFVHTYPENEFIPIWYTDFLSQQKFNK